MGGVVMKKALFLSGFALSSVGHGFLQQPASTISNGQPIADSRFYHRVAFQSNHAYNNEPLSMATLRPLDHDVAHRGRSCASLSR